MAEDITHLYKGKKVAIEYWVNFDFKIGDIKEVYIKDLNFIRKKIVDKLENIQEEECYNGYAQSLRLLHPDIKWKSISFGICQGDIVSIGIDAEGYWYYKNNSYGSCSGCDWIQGIETESQAEEFFKNQEVLDKVSKDKDKFKEYLKKESTTVYDFETDKLLEFYKFIDEN